MQRISFRSVTPHMCRVFQSEAGPMIWIENRSAKGDPLELEMTPANLDRLLYLLNRARDLIEQVPAGKVTTIHLPEAEAKPASQPVEDQWQQRQGAGAFLAFRPSDQHFAFAWKEQELAKQMASGGYSAEAFPTRFKDFWDMWASLAVTLPAAEIKRVRPRLKTKIPVG